MRLWVGLVPMAAIAGGALAQGGAAPPPAQLRAVTACRAVADAGERLSCLDKAAAALDAAVAAREVTVLDRESVRRTRRSLFGFTLPRIGPIGGDDGEADAPEFQELTTKITRVIPAGFQRYELVLAEGGRWVTADPAPRAPQEGASIRIRRGLLGSYMMNVGTQRGIRGRRVG